MKINITDKIQISLEDNMELMSRYPDGYFDLAIVDPPYGISITNSGRLGKYGGKGKNWDDETPDSNYFKELFRVSKKQIIWGGNYFSLPPCKCFLIWDKQQPEAISFASCEFAWSNLEGSAKTFYMRPQGADNIRIHPTQKPVKLYKWILDKYAGGGDKILDTHLGSGSIAIACHDYDFELVACEIDKDYFLKTKQRLENHVGQLQMFK